MSEPVPGEGYRPVLARLVLLLDEVRLLLLGGAAMDAVESGDVADEEAST